MKEFIVKIALWIVKKLGWEVMDISPEIRTIKEAALAKIKKIDSTPSVSGEWKRHQVYAYLIKKFPHVRKTAISVAIELAVMEIK